MRALLLAPPWLFVLVFAGLYATFLLPAMRAGHAWAIVVGAVAALAFLSSLAAALTMTRDVLRGRDLE